MEFADPSGGIREETATADSAQAVRRRYVERGIPVRSVQARRAPAAPPTRGRINLQQFVVFNEQFLALIRAGMPIPQSLDLLADNVRSKVLANHLAAVRDDVKVGVETSQAFANRRAFPPIYITSLLAGERSGALASVLERYVTYQKLTLAIRKKILVSLIYPAILVALVIALVTFLVTFVVPEFAALYETMDAALPVSTQLLVGLGTASRDNWMWLLAGLVATVAAGAWGLRSDAARISLERITFRTPVIGQLWIRYHVAQVSRLLGTLLTGGHSADAGAGHGERVHGIGPLASRPRVGPGTSARRPVAHREPVKNQDLSPAGDRNGAGRREYGRRCPQCSNRWPSSSTKRSRPRRQPCSA